LGPSAQPAPIFAEFETGCPGIDPRHWPLHRRGEKAQHIRDGGFDIIHQKDGLGRVGQAYFFLRDDRHRLGAGKLLQIRRRRDHGQVARPGIGQGGNAGDEARTLRRGWLIQYAGDVGKGDARHGVDHTEMHRSEVDASSISGTSK